MRSRLKKVWQWLRKNVINKNMLFWFIIAELIFWSPCIVTGILAITVDPWYWSAFGAIIAFWAGPFTPAVLLQLGLAGLLKKIFGRRKEVEPDDVRGCSGRDTTPSA